MHYGAPAPVQAEPGNPHAADGSIAPVTSGVRDRGTGEAAGTVWNLEFGSGGDVHVAGGFTPVRTPSVATSGRIAPEVAVLDKPQCGCKDAECKIHRERPCPMPSRLDGYKSDTDMTPFCVPCAAHALATGWKMRARPGDSLGR